MNIRPQIPQLLQPNSPKNHLLPTNPADHPGRRTQAFPEAKRSHWPLGEVGFNPIWAQAGPVLRQLLGQGSALTWVILLLIPLLAACGDDPTPTPTPQPPPTYTPTPDSSLGAAAANVVTPTLAITNTTTPLPLPTPTPQPTPPPAPAERLVRGKNLHRYGDYAAARSEFAALLALPTSEPQLRWEARYMLARAYLADDSSGEALVTLDQLAQDLAAGGAAAAEYSNKAHFLRGLALHGQGQFDQAIAAYWLFLEKYPWMAEAVQPRIAAAYLALGDAVGAAAAYRRAADATSDVLARTNFLEQLAQSYNNAGQSSEAVKAYDEILAVAQNAGYRAEIQHLAGVALASAGDGPQAIARWRAATTEAPASKAAYSALIELVNRNADFDLYQRGYIDLQAEAAQPAINAFQAYLDKAAPSDSRVALARHGLGQAYLLAEDYDAALATLDQLITQHPQCPCYGQAWLDKAAAQNALGDSSGARRTYRTFAREHATDPLAAEALWRSGYQALLSGNQIEAATDLLTLSDTFTQSERAPLALYVVGLGAYQQKLYGQAVELYSRLQQDYPDYRWDAVGFWLGRAEHAQGNPPAARKTWQALVDRAPDIYYGILAGFALHQASWEQGRFLTEMAKVVGPPSTLANDDGSQQFAESWLQSWIKSPDPNLAALPPALAEDVELRMGRLLLEFDQRGPALAILDRLFQRNKDDPRALYALTLEFEQLQVYRLSIVAAQRLLEFSPAKLVEDTPIFLQQHAYPRHFEELIEKEAQAHQLNPLLYYSLIRQESLFEEGARSSAAAQGLAQIIPDTGHWVATQLGHPDYTNEIIYRPQINVRFGAYYLDWVRDAADGNLVSALAGYNGGPGNIERWRSISGADDSLFVDAIDYPESRSYIQAVTTNLYHYTRLYGQ